MYDFDKYIKDKTQYGAEKPPDNEWLKLSKKMHLKKFMYFSVTNFNIFYLVATFIVGGSIYFYTNHPDEDLKNENIKEIIKPNSSTDTIIEEDTVLLLKEKAKQEEGRQTIIVNKESKSSESINSDSIQKESKDSIVYLSSNKEDTLSNDLNKNKVDDNFFPKLEDSNETKQIDTIEAVYLFKTDTIIKADTTKVEQNERGKQIKRGR